MIDALLFVPRPAFDAPRRGACQSRVLPPPFLLASKRPRWIAWAHSPPRFVGPWSGYINGSFPVSGIAAARSRPDRACFVQAFHSSSLKRRAGSVPDPVQSAVYSRGLREYAQGGHLHAADQLGAGVWFMLLAKSAALPLWARSRPWTPVPKRMDSKHQIGAIRDGSCMSHARSKATGSASTSCGPRQPIDVEECLRSARHISVASNTLSSHVACELLQAQSARQSCLGLTATPLT